MANNTYNMQFSDAVDKLNKMAKMIVGGNAKDWASKSVRAGIIDYDYRVTIVRLVDL